MKHDLKQQITQFVPQCAGIALIEGLKDSSSEVRQAAAAALGSTKNEQAVPPLIAALGDRTSQVRRAAAEALGRLGDRRAVEPLVDLLDESESSLEQAAAIALNKLGWQPDPGSAGIRYWLAQGLTVSSSHTVATCRLLLAADADLWRFVSIPGLEPTNNSAERALRHSVLWRRASHGTQSEHGSRFVERILTVVETCRQQ